MVGLVVSGMGRQSMTIFETMALVSYELLTLEAQVGKRRIIERQAKLGVFIERTGKARNGYGEEYDRQSLLYIRPEDFRANILEYGVAIDGVEYDITGYAVGKDYHTGVLEHYKLTLTRAVYAAS